ncbi:MAG: hypothetical protein JO170_31790 [Verrucomicrobia bacterium]|nr:hypothetical protein [Verrucomicrobiota bacterium]
MLPPEKNRAYKRSYAAGMTRNYKKRALARQLLRKYLPAIPNAEHREILSILLERSTEPRPEVYEVLDKLRAGASLEDLGQPDLVQLARPTCHVTGEQSSWVVRARKYDLIDHLDRNRDALDLL